MTYRDNEVYLSIDGGFSLIGGSYTITSFSITSGQDPDRHIYNGLRMQFGSNGKMNFSIGRKGSSDNARWFNDRVPANKNTFGHTADDLNFAFLGTLTLTLTGGILGGAQATYTFYNVSLAQGHSGLSNNWWFGGQNCVNIQNNRVNSQGVNAQNQPVSFVCLRGGNDVNVVGITPTVLIDTATWMRRINDATALDQIMMPGSHDAGMSSLSHCAPFVGAEGATRTQALSVGQQLSSGSRYFDIRVDFDYGELVTYHRTDGWGCNGQSLQSVLDQTRNFLLANPSETAILKFSHIREYEDHHASDTKLKINQLLSNYSNVMYVNATSTVNLAKINIGQARGKMILVFDYSEYINTSTGRFRYMDGSAAQSGANITVYDEYSDTADYEVMKANQLQKWQTYGGMGKGYLFLLSWTLTASALGRSVESLAAEANGKLPGVLYDQIVVKKSSKPNIVYIDFVNSFTTQSIIQYNF